MTIDARDQMMMHAAARVAVRGHGRAEPNPLVGCVITDAQGVALGAGWHERYGGPHAEINALRRAGERARGGTAYVTLEPCNHTGQTGPCSAALVEAGVARVVIARDDPHPGHGGGAAKLRAAGVQVDALDRCPAAVAVSDPFVHRVRTGRPWVTAKWAQTLDGRIATRDGSSRWISSVRSRRLVHRERGRVDAILTGVGTVLADDPLLTAREGRARRIARRVVVDPALRTPPESKLVRTAREVPTTIVHDVDETGPRAGALRDAGVDLLPLNRVNGELPLAAALEHLTAAYDATNVLVEGGADLLGRLLRSRLVNEAWVFVAPLLLADDAALPCATGLEVARLADGVALELRTRRERDGDVVLRYRIAGSPVS